ncbi:uncharacterized protein LACBIDRAFT_334268 [Laccaria bicolor S238N-H82]|uniref:Predicted protein n=1 Tax=Laccaria bicolor (strain S238N-H82 / ATCC MYA-4686) TaxID=486041 RepID=B0DYP1_LACBS|nr:uncharacterized protein LACBIDRAFT_334268 [Laccaria bicolor S238N-H82]EDR00327.1 predicted protein [Laccaria bicolor S238N-H82]|eukprot:XP_001889079.1 predicted protein [Laccaria bicolor S238N-H82]
MHFVRNYSTTCAPGFIWFPESYPLAYFFGSHSHDPTMKFFVSLLSILSPAVVGVMGALIGPLNIPPDALSEYFKLFKLCEDAGANSYVGVLYQNDQYVTYKFGQCYPYQLSNGNLAKMAVFCKSSTCNNNPWALIISEVWRTALLIAYNCLPPEIRIALEERFLPPPLSCRRD